MCNLQTAWRLLALLVTVVATPVQAGFTVPPNRPGDFAPRDECSQLPGAQDFLADLRRIVGQRDAAALLALSAETIQLDYGGGAGREELGKRLSGSEGADLWRELEMLMTLGCAASEQGELILPWFFAQDLGDVDPYDVMLAMGPRVPIYAARSAKGRRASWLNWQLVVPRVLPKPPRGFSQVAVINSRLEGLVAENRLRSPIGFRLIASRQSGEWLISAFIAGD